MTAERQIIIGVIGAGDAENADLETAQEVGEEIAASGFTLLCGGMGGVMEAASRGAKSKGGTTIGILPGGQKRALPKASGRHCKQRFSMP